VLDTFHHDAEKNLLCAVVKFWLSGVRKGWRGENGQTSMYKYKLNSYSIFIQVSSYIFSPVAMNRLPATENITNEPVQPALI
jgi:hypothetical protein